MAELLRPMPGAVVSSVIWDDQIRRDGTGDFAVPHSLDDPSLSGTVGLALGSATSPVVGERIIGHLLNHADIGEW